MQVGEVPLDVEQVELSEGRLSFELEFSTRETPSPGDFHDSITISLARADGDGGGGGGVPLVIGDVFGLTLAPLPPGSVFSPGGLTVREIGASHPILDGATVAFAYRVDVDLAPPWRGVPLVSSFSLFDNADAAGSQAAVVLNVKVVPEPGERELLVLGIAVLAGARRRGGSGGAR